MQRRNPTLVGMVLLFISTAAFAGELTATDKKGLDESLEKWITSFNKHDATAVAKTYTEDTDLMGPDGTRFKGRAAVQKYYAEFFSKNPNVKSKISGVSRRVLAPGVIVEDGTWEERGHSEAGQPTKGLYCAILVKKNGEWIVVHERAWTKQTRTENGE